MNTSPEMRGTFELAVIGAGNMAEAIVRGATGRGILVTGSIVAADPSPQRRDLFEKTLGVRAVENSAEAASQARLILLSVKPQQMAAVLESLRPHLDERNLIISIAAGISTSFIAERLGGETRWRIVRVMPNTPMLVGEGMTALARGGSASDEDLAEVRRLFESAGAVIEVNEDRMNAVTAVSGSGPAYFFFLVEQMIRAGVELGLSGEHAAMLARRTALGAAKMLTTSTETPQELRRRVTSPGGTTHAAISHLEQQHVDQSIVDAIKAAERRGRELGG